MNIELEVDGETVFIDDDLHHELNALAGQFYINLGYKALDGHDYYKSKHPQEHLMYVNALTAFIFIRNTGFGT